MRRYLNKYKEALRTKNNNKKFHYCKNKRYKRI